MSTDTPVEVPLVERLRRIPKAHKVSVAFQFADNGTATGHSIIPVGYLMHTAADELARLREELAAIHAAWPDGLDEIESSIQQFKQRAEQAEARALEYKTEHAALLGTSQWQETEIADLRDDVKRLMQTVSECEERALANEKAIDALHIAICQASLALSNGELPYDANAILRQALVDYADAAIGAKNG